MLEPNRQVLCGVPILAALPHFLLRSCHLGDNRGAVEAIGLDVSSEGSLQMAIDDELDALKSQYPESSKNIGLEVSLRTLTAMPGGIGLAAKILDILRNHFSAKAMAERTHVLFDALERTVRRLDKKISDIETRLDSPEFAQAYVAVANIAIFTANPERIRQFGSILGYEAASSDIKGWDEAAALVADLSSLTDNDLQALRLMVQFQGEKVRDNPSDAEYHLMLTEFAKVRDEATRRGVSRYDLYARALRLSGFGLAHPLSWNQTAWGPQDMGFAPTPRGKRLVQILDVK